MLQIRPFNRDTGCSPNASTAVDTASAYLDSLRLVHDALRVQHVSCD